MQTDTDRSITYRDTSQITDSDTSADNATSGDTNDNTPQINIIASSNNAKHNPSVQNTAPVSSVHRPLSCQSDAAVGECCADGGSITLQTQRSDPRLAPIIDYLQRGDIPADDKTARQVILTKDQYLIRDGRLFHLGTNRRKNNGTDQPIAEQLCIPVQDQPVLLARYHAQLMHCGYEKMYLTMKQRVYWPNMYTAVRDFVGQCVTCYTAKADHHPVRVPIRCRDVPPALFQRIHLDHLKISVKGATHGYTHAVVMIDAMSLCCEIIPVKSTSAAETCRVLLREWIARYGVFSEILTDRHRAFTGKLTQLLLEWCGIRHVLIGPYHSRSNGQVEKMNSVILQGLRIHCRGLTEWNKLLGPIAAAYKAAVIPNRGASPFKLMFGVDMRLPVESDFAKDLPAHRRPTENIDTLASQLAMMRTHAQALAQASRERGAKTANKKKQPQEFRPGDRAYKVRDALGDAEDRKTASKFLGPFTILEKGPNDVYKLANFYTGRIMKNFVHVDKLRSSRSTRAAKNNDRNVTCITTEDHTTHTACIEVEDRASQTATPPGGYHCPRRMTGMTADGNFTCCHDNGANNGNDATHNSSAGETPRTDFLTDERDSAYNVSVNTTTRATTVPTQTTYKLYIPRRRPPWRAIGRATRDGRGGTATAGGRAAAAAGRATTTP